MWHDKQSQPKRETGEWFYSTLIKIVLKIAYFPSQTWRVYGYLLKVSSFLKYKSEFAQLCLTLCDPTDCSLLGFSVNGMFQAGVLEWVAISFSKGSSRPSEQTHVSCIAGFTL